MLPSNRRSYFALNEDGWLKLTKKAPAKKS
jgi:hypothetical protein